MIVNGKESAFSLRLPPEFKRWLKHQAVDNSRSLNSEIMHRLKASREQEEQAHAQKK